MSGYKPSELMKRHLAAVVKDPSKALELSAPLRKELDGLSEADLAEMAQAVKFSKGRPIHLTDEQNEAFKAQNRHMPSFSAASEASAPGTGTETGTAEKVPRAPAGKFGGPVGGQSDENSMSDAWAKFGGSFEAFKEEVFKPVPADLRVGKQEWLVQGVVHQPGGGVGLLNCGSFQEAEAAMGHAERMQAWRPYFDFNVVSQWGCESPSINANNHSMPTTRPSSAKSTMMPGSTMSVSATGPFWTVRYMASADGQ